MEWLSGGVINLSHFSRSYLSLISLALTAVIIAYAGKSSLSRGGRWLERLPAALRIPIRSVFNLTVLGGVLYYLPNVLTHMFGLFSDLTLAPILFVIFVLSGVLADRYG
ncbi:MAG: DUF3392 family protein [Candidatus Endonucleobacter bathymodioli]|uniref:DUF3392 family protein n=1 Tax=Candidatus Endonucleibacter bathymodioli TaxID=539814 RepID=A0AA90SY95_9GAMM|nr:DUF3392 family protein [Candidatus Endonucleobacter bathymodioli]